jgi:hypothetical protein
MTLLRALHGRAAMTGVGAPWPIMGELAREGREGEGEGRGGRGWGGTRGAIGGGLGPGCSVLSHDCLLYVREESMKDEGEEKREKRKKEGNEKKKRRKNGKNF